jgi:hypothetical protein
MFQPRVPDSGSAELSLFAMLGGGRFLRPGGRGGFREDTDAVERRGGCAGALERFLRAA